MGFVAAIGTITFIGVVERLPLAARHRPDQESWTVQIALSTFLTAQSVQLSRALHGRRSSRSAPLVLMFLFLQRWIVEGVERSGIND